MVHDKLETMTGNPVLDKIIYGINIIGLVLGSGVVFYKDFIFEKPYPDEFLEYQKMVETLKSDTKEKSFKFDKIILNLKSSETRLRFVSFNLEVVVFKDSELKMIENNKPIINDSIIEIVNHMTPEEINSVTGKILFENKIKRSINEIAKRPIVKKIYFTTFIVQ